MKKRPDEFIRIILRRMFDKLRSINLKRKFFFIISFTVLVSLLFCFFVFRYTAMENSRQEKEQGLYNYFSQSREQLDLYLKQVDFIAYTVMFSSWVQKFFDYRSTSVAELLLYRENVQRFLQSLSSLNNDIYMVLITEQELIYSATPARYYDPSFDVTKQSWFPDLIKNKKHMEYGIGSRKLFGEYGKQDSVTIFHVVTNVSNFSHMGYFAINIPIEKFDFLLNDLQYDWIKVTDSEGNIILDNPSSYFVSENVNPGGFGWISHEDTLMNGIWNVRLYRRLPDFPVDGIKNYYLFLLLLVPILGLFVIITFSFSRYLTNPIVRCRNAMLEIQNNHFGLMLENHYRDEIGGLIDGFNDMSSTLVSLRQKNIEIEKLRREAEIDILQQKVNPHFLYNTLEIINALILDGQYDAAVQVCELLGHIYHYNLMNRKWVSLRDEVEYVKRYLKILQYKINGLSVVWEIPDDTLETECLKLILQPLVENAVLHGLRSRQDDACLTLSFSSPEDGVTEIKIMDNGSGMDPGALSETEETLAQIRQGIFSGSSHIGIPNVYQRLYLEYGSELTFAIESRLGYGTKVNITIPKKIT